jgi:hypothetical protein
MVAGVDLSTRIKNGSYNNAKLTHGSTDLAHRLRPDVANCISNIRCRNAESSSPRKPTLPRPNAPERLSHAWKHKCPSSSAYSTQTYRADRATYRGTHGVYRTAVWRTLFQAKGSV